MGNMDNEVVKAPDKQVGATVPKFKRMDRIIAWAGVGSPDNLTVFRQRTHVHHLEVSSLGSPDTSQLNIAQRNILTAYTFLENCFRIHPPESFSAVVCYSLRSKDKNWVRHIRGSQNPTLWRTAGKPIPFDCLGLKLSTPQSAGAIFFS